MKGVLYFIALLILMTILFLNCIKVDDKRTAKEIGISVADKIIKESAFVLKTVPLISSFGIQVLDYSNEFENSSKGVFYSVTSIKSDVDTNLTFGVSYSGQLNIYLNSEPVFSKASKSDVEFKEIAYNMFSFQDTINITINKGVNNIFVELKKLISNPIVIIKELPYKSELSLTSSFELNLFNYKNIAEKWLSIGLIEESDSIKKDILESNFKIKYLVNEKEYKWQLLKEKVIKEFIIPDESTYKNESYLEWHYANGTVLFGLQYLSDVLEDKSFNNFVLQVINFNLENYDLFKNQYYNLHAFRGSNHRMFRKTMLDDTSAPALPYLNYYIQGKDKKVKFLVDEINDYVSNQQIRLEDKTFCRPEPVEWTIWADDLFMSVPFLVRMGNLTRDSQYYDDAALQIINFNKYLFDKELGIYKHGWFSDKNQKSVAYWGRANGWVIWATTEALLHLPKDHKDYQKIKNIFNEHMEGLIKFQSKEGMWHQILNKPTSFKETSCTSMFIIGILRGIENGWLDTKYKLNALQAWNELKTKIAIDGTVKDICRGTGIGYDLDFYFNRKRFDNDPRGLGAVITAIAEIIKMENQFEN